MDGQDAACMHIPPVEKAQAPPTEPEEETVRTIHGFKVHVLGIHYYPLLLANQ